jgi:hypothetical protein
MVGVLASAFAQQSVQAQPGTAPTAANLQNDSIRRQMDAITSSAAVQQAESIKRQSEAIRTQYGNSVPDSSLGVARASSALPVQDQEKATAGGPSPLPSSPTPAESSSPQTAVTRGPFYTVPWADSDDFSMPNVQVDAMTCDPLDEGQVGPLIQDASSKYKLDGALLRAVMLQESGFRPCAVSTAGAAGLMQIMPETADDLGLQDPFDPAANVDAGARYLKQMLDRYHGNTALALAAYNAGPGRTDKSNGIPQIAETVGYVSRILGAIPLF